MQALYENGARNFLVIDVGPLGCSPGVRLAGVEDWKGGCMETVNELAMAHNAALSQLINHLKRHFNKGCNILVNIKGDSLNNLSTRFC